MAKILNFQQYNLTSNTLPQHYFVRLKSGRKFRWRSITSNVYRNALIMAAVAAMERSLLVERTDSGLARAKA
jgi:DNA invertase Pin-like site-specific DNA recombinase